MSHPDALTKLIRDAIQFAIWAGGQGISPAKGEPALAPEDFVYAYSQATGDEDWDTLPGRAASFRATPPSPVPERWVMPPYGKMPFDELGRDVSEAIIGVRSDFDFGEAFPGHVMTGINFNSLNRIVSKYAAKTAAPAAPNGWQPIETAERVPGNRILAYCPDKGIRATRFVSSEGTLSASNTDGWWQWDEPTHNWSQSWKPTHWMPLPAAPTEARDE